MNKVTIIRCMFCNAETFDDEAFGWVCMTSADPDLSEEWCCPYCMGQSLPEYPGKD